MKNPIVIALALATTISGAAMSQAQNSSAPIPETGTRLSGHFGSVTNIGVNVSQPGYAFSPEQAALSTQRTARCLLSRKPGDVAAYLNTERDSQESSAYKVIETQLPGCLGLAAYVAGYGGSTLRMTPYMLQGMLAEAEIGARHYPLLQAAADVRASYAASWMDTDTGREAVDEMGACLADWRPEESVDLLKTVPGSSQESKILSSLLPLFSTCLRKGASLKTNALGMRSAIALGLYHRIVLEESAMSSDNITAGVRHK